jgi:predicted nucleic acid-binding Zn ribbon protein
MSGPVKKSQPTSIADVMAKMLEQKGMTERIAQVSAMDDWPQMVGAQIASVTEPLSISADGTLWVRVTTAAWMNELSLLAPTLLKRLNDSPGRQPVKQLRFRLGRA